MSSTASVSPFRHVPLSLICLRFALGPVFVFGAHAGWNGWLLVAIATVGFFSDVYDGIIARRIGVSTEWLREADSWVDTWYYGLIGLGTWHLFHAEIVTWAWPLGLLAATQLSCWVFDFAKYRRFATYHNYSAKAWNISLFVLIVSLYGFHYAGISMGLMVAVGVLSHLDGLLMTALLPQWTYDVPGVWAAMALRPAQLASEG